MKLKDIGLYKSRIANAFTTSSDIGELMLGNTYDEEIANEQLMYHNIFPYLYIEGTQTEEKSYLCFDIDIPKVVDDNLKNIEITVFAYCHKRIMDYKKTDFMGDRADILADMAERCISGSEKLGIGKLKLDSSRAISLGENFYGRKLVYKNPDFVRR